MAADQQIQLKKLRDILLSEDEQRVLELEKELKLLRERIDDTDELLEKLEPVIADSISRKISDSKEDMADALAPVMGPAIKRQIEDTKEDMIDALYPIIGSTIRKSIAEAMKKLAVSVNEKIDKALSIQNIFRRAKSRMTGVSEAELAIKDALPFQIHEVFLIHKETGLLLAHVSQETEQANSNEEIISGMLTAIREFANTAFQKNGSHQLHEIQYDDMQIHLEDGRYSYLAVVTEGQPPDNFHELLAKTEQKIHNLFYKALRGFDGNSANFKRSNQVLDKLLITFLPEGKRAERKARSKPKPEPSATRGFAYLFIIMVLIGTVVIFFLGVPKNFLGLLNRQPQAVSSIDVTVLNEIRAQLLNNFSFASDFRYIMDGEVLTIYGEVPDEDDKILVGKAITEFPEIKTLINNLNFQNALTDIPSQLQHQVENTVLYFDENSTRLTSESIEKLDSLVPILQSYSKQNIYLHGHSDIQGDENANLKISRKRAENVKTYLVQSGNLVNEIELLSWGTEKPIASNDTPEGRAQNRRVNFSFSKEIYITRK